MKSKLTLLLLCLVFIFSCKKDDDKNNLGGSQSAIGALNNTFTFSLIPGIQNITAKVTDLSSDVSTITVNATITDANLTPLLQALSGSTVSANNFSRISKYKMTSEGIQSKYSEGDLILVKYDCAVGDEYSIKIGNNTIKRTVTAVSTTDDYLWNGMYIKTIKVLETGRGIAGVPKIEFIANHKFGLVGIVVYFEDNSTQQISIISTNTD